MDALAHTRPHRWNIAVEEIEVRTTHAAGTLVKPERGLVRLLGPAFVAAVAYVDPGNVAANLSAGAKYGYLLVWVLVVANAMAVLVQYLSAKFGLVTGRSLPEMLGERMGTRGRIAFWLQAQSIAIATDVAEVIGGALALYILFDLPLLVGGIIVGGVSFAILSLQRSSQLRFERLIIGLLSVIAIGFVAGLFFSPLDWGGLADGLVPRFAGTESVLLAASMLGATVMPHAIYLHSSLSRDRHGVERNPVRLSRLLKATRWDVVLALFVAGGVNISMLLLAAASLPGVAGTDSIEGAAAAISMHLGPAIGVIFAIGLLASGLASSSVGAYAGSEIMSGMLRRRVPVRVSRLITLAPALLLLAVGVDPTWALVVSQVVLSFGIPFAIIPLIWFTSRRDVMGAFVNPGWLRVAAIVAAALIVALNLALLGLTFFDLA